MKTAILTEPQNFLSLFLCVAARLHFSLFFLSPSQKRNLYLTLFVICLFFGAFFALCIGELEKQKI